MFRHGNDSLHDAAEWEVVSNEPNRYPMIAGHLRLAKARTSSAQSMNLGAARYLGTHPSCRY